jgi:Zn/Cd-binding protein ZinT
MKMRETTWIQLMVLGLLTSWLSSSVVLAAEEKANVTGTWKWSFTTPSGQTFETALKLKQEGDKLTGAVIGRDGTETAIEAAGIKDNEVTFTVTRERNGQKFTTKYQGKLVGDTIKGASESEREGQTTKRDWEAKRAKAGAEPTGTWKWSYTGQDGETRESTLKLKLADGKLTGSLTGRGGTETAISDAVLKGEELSFSVTRERGDQKFTSKYAGKISGDVIKGKIEMAFGDQTRSRDWEAKREKAADATGTWQWKMTLQDGTAIERTVRLKQEGGKLTGVTIGRDGTERPIEEGKVQGGEVTFQVTFERDGNKVAIKYRGKVEGDSLKGKIEGNFGGEPRSFDWDAKRAK